MTPENLQQYISYVIQDSLKVACLTSREILTSVAELRWADVESPESIEKRVLTMIHELQLEKCADSRFGDDLDKGLSGGEKKRVCIGAKLLIDSPILLLDEPTSGLDSNTSFIIIKLLREYARKHNKIILTTIHQPSSNIFDLFDKLIILNHGRIIYQGLGSLEVCKYFESKGFPLKIHQNPADSVMRVLEELNRRSDQKFFFNNEYDKDRDMEIKDEINNYILQTHEEKNDNILRNIDIYSSFITALKVHFRDYSKTVARNPQTIRIKVTNFLLFAFMCGSIFWKLPNTLEGNRGKLGFILFFTLSNITQQLLTIIMVFPLERKILIEDYKSNLYGVVPYGLARQCIDTPINLLIVIVYCSILYFVVGMKETPVNFFIFIGIYISFAFNVISIGILFACFIESIPLGFLILSFAAYYLLIFSGVVLNAANIPVWLAWLKYLNPVFYGIQSVMINEFEGRNFEGGINFYELIRENLDIWHCMVYLIVSGLILRSMALVGLHLVVNKKI